MKQPSVWLFVDLALAFGGHEVMLLRWMKELHRQQLARVVLVCAQGSRLADQARAYCEVHELVVSPSQGSRTQKALGLVKVTLALVWLRLKHRPAWCVVAEGCMLAQRHGLYAARMVGLKTLLYVPLSSSFADMGFADAERLDRITRQCYAKLPNGWVVINERQAKELAAWAGCRQPMFTLPNTISDPDGHHPSLEHPPRAPASPCKVLILGRIDFFQKGIDLVLQHLSDHPQDASGCHISIIGEGPDAGLLEAALAAHPHLRDIITTQAWSDAAVAMSEHDVLLLPSRFEGVPLVMLEAMASARPVIATRLAGTQPYLMDEALSEAGDMHSLFRNLRNVAGDIERYRAQALANRQTFFQSFSPAVFADAVAKIHAQLEQRPPAAAEARHG